MLFLGKHTLSPLPEELGRALPDFHERITSVLSETAFFHGTGAKHRQAEGESKYDGVRDDVIDFIDVLEEKGLLPQDDPLNNLNGAQGVSKTLSLSHSGLYAGLYAKLYQLKDDLLLWEAMKRTHYWRKFLYLMAKNGFRFSNLLKFGKLRHIKHSNQLGDAATKWATNNSRDPQYTSKIGSIRYMFNGFSDIPGNFPILVGIKNMQTLPLEGSTMYTFEDRIDTPIPVENMTHIQVPWKYVSQVQARLTIPVLPMELCEYVMYHAGNHFQPKIK